MAGQSPIALFYQFSSSQFTTFSCAFLGGCWECRYSSGIDTGSINVWSILDYRNFGFAEHSRPHSLDMVKLLQTARAAWLSGFATSACSTQYRCSAAMLRHDANQNHAWLRSLNCFVKTMPLRERRGIVR